MTDYTIDPGATIDRLIAERDAALGREAQSNIKRAKSNLVVCAQYAKIEELQQRLTAADERADAGIAFVTRLIECASSQPSIATGYLRDILAALKPAECDHSYHHFGTEQPRRRCNLCNKLEPAEGRGDDRPNGCCCPPKGFTGLWAGASCPIHQGLRAIKP